MKITKQGVDKDALRQQHNPQIVGAQMKCWKCGLRATTTEDDFKGWFPRLSVTTYWYDGVLDDGHWTTRVSGRCPNCLAGGNEFYALLSRRWGTA